MKKLISLLNTINSLVLENNIIKPNNTVLIAVSGGQDSICVVFLFFILKKQWKLEIIFVYCNHLWKHDSLYTFLHLSKIALTLKIPLSYSITTNLETTEQKARNWRLKNYYRFTKFFNASSILTGHTQSDRIETFLFNMLRGTGLKGTSSLKLKKIFTNLENTDFIISKRNLVNLKKFKQKKISFINYKKKTVKKINNIKTIVTIDFLDKKKFFIKKSSSQKMIVFRPLIKQSRLDIKKTCNNWKLPIFPDTTNQETRFTRNRIRKQLLPTLKFFFNPKIDLILCRYNNILVEEEQILENLVLLIFPEILIEHQKFYSLNLSLFYSFPLGLQRKICFLFFSKNLRIKFTYQTINLFISLLNNIFRERNQTSRTSQKTDCKWFFFPKIGIIFTYKTIITFIK